MNNPLLHHQPSEVSAEEGEVLVDGPDGVSVSFHPDAAEETARRLMAAAAEARTQAPTAKRAWRENPASP